MSALQQLIQNKWLNKSLPNLDIFSNLCSKGKQKPKPNSHLRKCLTVDSEYSNTHCLQSSLFVSTLCTNSGVQNPEPNHASNYGSVGLTVDSEYWSETLPTLKRTLLYQYLMGTLLYQHYCTHISGTHTDDTQHWETLRRTRNNGLRTTTVHK